MVESKGKSNQKNIFLELILSKNLLPADPFSPKLYHWGHATAHLFKINPSRIVCYNTNVFIKFQNRLIIKREWIIGFSSIHRRFTNEPINYNFP